MDLRALEVDNQQLRVLSSPKDLRAVVASVVVDLQTIFLQMILQMIGGTAKVSRSEKSDEEPRVLYSNEIYSLAMMRCAIRLLIKNIIIIIQVKVILYAIFLNAFFATGNSFRYIPKSLRKRIVFAGWMQ